MKIIKRSGQEVLFDAEKIFAAVAKANAATAGARELTPTQIRAISDRIEEIASSLNRALSVEEIQELVETEIMKAGAYETAKRYIRYRYTRTLVRQSNTTDELNAKLFEGRDPNMIAWADRYLKQSGSHTGLMTVGAGHMIGKTGVVQGLRDLGYTVEAVPVP